MKTRLLLRKTIDKLGIVGDVVEVTPGYARNYLIPQGLATEPTESNIRALADARKVAELERLRQLEAMAELAEKLDGHEITVRAKANEDGVLYGSVGRKDIAEMLEAEGFPITQDHISMSGPIRHLDNVSVDLKLSDAARATVKVWVVREKEEGEEDDEVALTQAGTEAGTDGYETGEQPE